MKKIITLLAFIILASPFWGDGRGVAQIITTVAGTGTQGYSGDGGAATAAEFNKPTGIAIDSYSNIYISDTQNNRIRMIDATGNIKTIAGNGNAGYSGDGGQATNAELWNPFGISIDQNNNLYIADYANDCVRKVNTSGIIKTVAGSGGTHGYGGDGGAATSALLNYPIGISVDLQNNLYISDYDNSLIRKVTATSEIITTVAGNASYAGGSGGYAGDGGAATVARLWSPYNTCLDTSNNLYIADYSNNRIRKVNQSSIINTFAGIGPSGSGSYSGDGGLATNAGLNGPSSLVFDAYQNLYFVDYTNGLVRKIDRNGIITTVVNGINNPFTLCFDKTGNLFITANNQVVKVVLGGCGSCTSIKNEELSTNNELKISPNPTNSIINVALRQAQGDTEMQVTDLLGNTLISTKEKNIDVSSLSNGVYFVRVGTSTQKFIKQ